MGATHPRIWRRAGALAGVAVAAGAVCGLSSCTAPFGRGSSCVPAVPTASPAVVAPGGQVTLASTGFDGCDTYADAVEYPLVLGTAGRQPPLALGRVTVATDGSFSAVVIIPPETAPGPAGLGLLGYPAAECDDSGSCVDFGSASIVVSTADGG